jgi:RND family efflux transporter MFP subunit
MNEVGINLRDRNDPIGHDRQNKRAGDPAAENEHWQRRRWSGRLFAIGGFLLLAGGLSIGAWGNYAERQEVMRTQEQDHDFVPSLRVATVEVNPGTVSVTLPGTTAAFAAANIYAHVSGYISERAVDIGDRVKKGELLALIDPRSYQAALDRAKAQLVHDEAVLKEAQVDLARYEKLLPTKAVPEQQVTDQKYLVEQDQGTIKLDEANVETAQLNLEYTRIIAPFDGVISQRNIDVGDLVQADATSGTYMFTTMRSDVMRIYLYVPQSQAVGTAPGVGAVFHVPEMPDRTFWGKVTRTADALQPGTRTLLAEIDIPNPDRALSPGMYGAVELEIPRKTTSLSVPADAIIFNRNGIQVAVVNNGRAEIRKVTVARDLGTRVELDSGIKAGDQVILKPPINLVDGSKVQPRPEATAADK